MSLDRLLTSLNGSFRIGSKMKNIFVVVVVCLFVFGHYKETWCTVEKRSVVCKTFDLFLEMHLREILPSLLKH